MTDRVCAPRLELLLMAVAVKPLPVRIRVGDGREYEVGTVTPLVRLCPDEPVNGNITALVDVAGPLAGLLREMVAALEGSLPPVT